MDIDDLLQAAMTEARRMGATYAEARSGETRREGVAVRNGAVERLTSERDSGWGIHVLAGGWGFAATSETNPAAVRETAQRAVSIARAAGERRRSRSDLSVLPSERGEYITPLTHDPFAVPVEERVALALEICGRIAAAGPRVAVPAVSLDAESHDTLYMNTAGAHLRQRIAYVQFRLTALARDDDGYAYRRSYDDMRQAGWEFVEAQNLLAEGERVGREASDLVVAPWAPAGQRPVVLGSDFVALLVHESCGHPTELDRVLGWETAFAGASFLQPEMRGGFRYGSPLVNMTADSLLPGGLGTFGWDSEGTPAQRAPLVQQGIFTGYLTSRESAAVLGQRSNGCGRATGWNRISLVRMVNVSLEPGTGTPEDLIAGVDDGLYIETPSSWSLDDKRMNFHFSGELCREITNGRLGDLRKGASFQGRTPEFWNAVEGIAGPDHWRPWGFSSCAKGEPLQLCPVSHGAAPILLSRLTLSGRG